MSVSQKPCTCV